MDRRALIKSITAGVVLLNTGLAFANSSKLANVTDYPDIQSAINAAGIGGTIYFPHGTYSVPKLTFLAHQIILGDGFSQAAGGSLGTIIKSTVTSGSAFILPFNNKVMNIEIQGTRDFNESSLAMTGNSSADCFDITGNPTFSRVRVRSWRNIGIIRTNCYYGKAFGCEFDRCDNVFKSTTTPVYNFEFNHTKILNCNGVIGGNALWRAVKFIGGSIESYGAAFNSIGNISLANVYLETFVDDRRVFVFNGVNNNASNMGINLTDCDIFMNHTDRFINFSGKPEATLRSTGNRLIVGTTIEDDTATAGTTSHTYLYVSPNHMGKVTMDDTVEFRGFATEIDLNYINNQNAIERQNITLP